MKPPFFDLILPTYNNLLGLRACFNGLAQQTFMDFRVLVCIDGSTDGTHPWVWEHREDYRFEILLLQHPDRANHGRNAARNLALPHLVAPYLVTLDTDLVPVPELLAEHKTMLERHNGWVASAGKVGFTDRNTSPWARYQHARGKAKSAHGAPVAFNYLTTGNLALPTRVFVELGGQDPTMRTYGGGDTEFAYRVHKAFQLPVVFNAKAAAWGRLDKSLARGLAQMREFGAINLRYIRQKHPEFNELYRQDLLVGKSLKARLFQLLLSRPVTAFVSRLRPLTRGRLEILLIHLVAVANIRRGFLQGESRPRVSETR